jgi:hypothetical protein
LRALIRTGTGVCAFTLLMLAAPGLIPDSHAGTAEEIDATVNAALARFGEQVQGADNFLRSGRGVLVPKDFRASSGWKSGVDGSVALINVGAGENIDTTTIKDPIVGFVIGQKGLMFNLSLEGSKISKLDR